MPELPEVETVCRGLLQSLAGNKIAKVVNFRNNLRFPLPQNLNKILIDKQIKDIKRRAKYILISLDDNITLLMHLGMSGKIIIHNKPRENRDKHDHVIFYTADNKEIVFNDPRRFGMIDLVASTQINQHKLIAKLGIEPLEDSFNGKSLQNLLMGRKQPIKLAIMDANLIVGIGNIYACEALFRSKISPQRPAGSLHNKECNILANNIKITLQEAIDLGGSTLRDYVTTSGGKGYFQHKFKVYGKEGESCSLCAYPIIRITQGGRSTFFCANCQE